MKNILILAALLLAPLAAIRWPRCTLDGLIYFPHPETKPEHFQQPDVLELLLPFITGLDYGAELRLEIPAAQMVIT